MLTAQDQEQLQSKGISEHQVLAQIKHFQQGFLPMKLIRAACVGDGIVQLSSDEVESAVAHYQSNLDSKDVVKFVPASGAASRMFKDFFSLMQAPDQADQFPKAVEALNQIQHFAFYPELKSILASDGLDLLELLSQGKYQIPLQYILTEKGLNYGFLPKGLLSFHQYGADSRTPLEEHLVEAAHYGKSGDNIARLHFTVSPEHRSRFDHLEAQKKPIYEGLFGLSYEITYSEQKPSTDTIAVDLNNGPFRNDDNSLLFRPGGHGALLENLNEIEADVIFIKNIDNIVPDHLKSETYRYKKALGGLLLSTQKKIFELLNRLENHDDSAITEAISLLNTHLGVQPASNQQESRDYAYAKLNRPLRVCGMVKNEGEPGGGPFWTVSADGSTTLQIVESSQVDQDSSDQVQIAQNATHFNPVDLVCTTRDYRGNKFNLLKYRDPATGFISHKSKDGRELKALELPGLWNGSMSEWNTIFVEVPAITFNPVKTVNDLLRKEHQPAED
jgi:hypothetical protein